MPGPGSFAIEDSNLRDHPALRLVILDSDFVSSRRNNIPNPLKACELRLKCLLSRDGKDEMEICSQ